MFEGLFQPTHGVSVVGTVFSWVLLEVAWPSR